MERFIYEVVIREEDGHFFAWVPDLSVCTGGGDTYAECLESICNGLETHIESLIAYGMSVPAPTFGHEVSSNEERVVMTFYVDTDVVDGYVSAVEAAKELGVSKSRVSHLIRDGKLKAYRQGRSTFVTRESLDERLSLV